MKSRVPLILDLGCGENKQPGALGIDIQGSQLDDRHDLNLVPWPFSDNQFVLIYARQVLEHLEDSVATFREIWRVARHGALVFVQVPNGISPGFIQDPTHRRPLNLGTFLYFCPSQWPGDWESRYRDFGVDFRVLHYHTTGERAGKTPWGDPLYADNLTVILQAIKEGE